MSSIALISTWVPNPSTTRGVSTKLSASKDGTKLAYGSGKSAIILPISSSSSSQQQQPIVFPSPHPITVVKISPSSFYAASGDTSGSIKIFSLDHSPSSSPLVKFEAKPLSKINDISWDGESKRFMVVGEGREAFGAVFSFETGASIGVVGGHNKAVNGVAMKGGRPFKAVTVSDDTTVCFHTGVPFKFESQSRKHTKFVQTTDYALDGSTFISAGSDGKLFIYEGLKGECLGEFVDESVGGGGHKGTIFAASFSGDSKSIATSSADGTVKLWDASSRALLQTWQFEQGTTIESQQVGNCFLGTSTIVSLSFSGILSFLQQGSDKPIRVINGHQTSITTLAQSSKDGTIYTGDVLGNIRSFSKEGECEIVKGSGHASRIVGMIGTVEGEIASVSYDDSVRFIEGGSGFSSTATSTGSLSKALASSHEHLFLATTKDIQSTSLSTKKLVATLPITYSATSIAVNKSGTIVAVGSEELKVHLYEHSQSGVFKFLGTCDLRNQVTALAFDPSEKFLAVGESTGKVLLFDVEKRELILSRWVYQSGRITSLVWHQGGKFIGSASLDQSIFVYSLDKPSEVVSVKNVHSGGVAQIVWSNSNHDELISVGADACIKKFSIKLVV